MRVATTGTRTGTSTRSPPSITLRSPTVAGSSCASLSALPSLSGCWTSAADRGTSSSPRQSDGHRRRSSGWRPVSEGTTSHASRYRQPTSNSLTSVRMSPRPMARQLGDARCVLGGAGARRRTRRLPAPCPRLSRARRPTHSDGPRWSDVGLRRAHWSPPALLSRTSTPDICGSRAGHRGDFWRWVSLLQSVSACRHRSWRATRRGRLQLARASYGHRPRCDGGISAASPCESAEVGLGHSDHRRGVRASLSTPGLRHAANVLSPNLCLLHEISLGLNPARTSIGQNLLGRSIACDRPSRKRDSPRAERPQARATACHATRVR